MQLLSDVHLGLPLPAPPDRLALVSGSYRYYHYGCDGVDDRGWGCGYRTLQTICSWLVEAGPEGVAARSVPSLREIQQALVEMGDKPPSFSRSREWIGTVEAALCMDHLYSVPGRLVHVHRGRDLERELESLYTHFQGGGGPVMAGGDRDHSAKALLGICSGPRGPHLLVLDPHYSGAAGSPTREELQGGGWVCWRELSFFEGGSFYNLCFPQTRTRGGPGGNRCHVQTCPGAALQLRPTHSLRSREEQERRREDCRRPRSSQGGLELWWRPWAKGSWGSRMLPRGRRRRCLWMVLLLVGVLVSIFLCSRRLSLQTQGLPPTLPVSRLRSVTLSDGTFTLSDGTFTFLLSRSRYEAEFPHLQHHPCRAVIAEAGVCQRGRGPPLLLLAVKSHPASSGRRAALRRTWARPGEAGGYRLQPLFLMAATPDPRHLSLVRQESRNFGDVLLWDFLESHHNLSLKERCFLQWFHRHCQQAAFVFKGDDDLFVNPEALAGYLRHSPNASLFVHGNIQRHAAVMRSGKYGVSRTLYPLDHYPYFASGGGFVLPGSSLPALYQASLQLPVFPLDDVYLGFLVLAAGLPFSHDERFRVWGAPEDQREVFRESFTVHGITPERMEEVWEGLRSPPRQGEVA